MYFIKATMHENCKTKSCRKVDFRYFKISKANKIDNALGSSFRFCSVLISCARFSRFFKYNDKINNIEFWVIKKLLF